MIGEQAYSAFFDELGEIEKRRMLTKIALGKEATLLGGVAKGFRSAAKNPGGIASRLSKAWQGGVRAQAKRVGALKPVQGPVPPGAKGLGKGVGDMGAWDKISGGLRGVARSNTGKAVGATALGVGAIGGAGYAAGRLTAPRQQRY